MLVMAMVVAGRSDLIYLISIHGMTCTCMQGGSSSISTVLHVHRYVHIYVEYTIQRLSIWYKCCFKYPTTTLFVSKPSPVMLGGGAHARGVSGRLMGVVSACDTVLGHHQGSPLVLPVTLSCSLHTSRDAGSCSLP